MTLTSKAIITGIGLILVFALGFFLSKLGKPYNQVLFNVHKLIALGVIVYTFIYLKRAMVFQNMSGSLWIGAILIVIAIIALFATGAMLSIGNIERMVLKRIHLPVAVLLLVGSGLFVYGVKEILPLK